MHRTPLIRAAISRVSLRSAFTIPRHITIATDVAINTNAKCRLRCLRLLSNVVYGRSSTGENETTQSNISPVIKRRLQDFVIVIRALHFLIHA